jgi:hypothetical protein
MKVINNNKRTSLLQNVSILYTLRISNVYSTETKCLVTAKLEYLSQARMAQPSNICVKGC